MLKIMNSPKPRTKLTSKTILLLIIGLVAFFLYILLFGVDILEVIFIIRSVNLSIFSIAIIISILDVFFMAISWQSILSSLKVKVSTLHSFLYTWDGIFIDTIIPTQGISSDLVRTYLVNQEQNGTSGKTAASVVMERILIMGVDVATLILGIAFLFNTIRLSPIIFDLTLLFTVALTLGMGFLLLVSWKEKWSTKIIKDLVRVGEFLGGTRWKQKIIKIEEETLNTEKIFHESMKEFGRAPAELTVPIFFLILEQISDFSVPYVVFLSLGLRVSWAVIFISASIVAAVKAIPTGIPFEVGIPEIAMTTFYTLMGVPAEIGATATILSRILTLWLRFGIGFAAQQYIESKN